MKIDRSNYEIWVIDWLDGNLSDIQAAQLFNFLEENPDIKTEFGEIENVRLKPEKNQITDKTKLTKSVGEISETQFEYLCAAFLENDLSGDQHRELLQMVKTDPWKKKTLGLISKTRLAPVHTVYPNKNRLFKRTVLQSAARLSVMILSAAAVITLAFILYFTRTRDLPLKFDSTARATVHDSSQKVLPEMSIPEKEPVRKTEPPVKKTINRAASVQQALKMAVLNSENTETKDSSAARSEILIEKVSALPDVDLKSEVPENLIAFNYSLTPEPVDEDRPKIGRFIAKTFREKFLRDKTPAESPLKGYEIAKAGVAGLNKLLGWEMALDERKDTEGNLKAVYFSSKLLKFNTPVKKSETLR
jgi:hypothetical protein